MPFPPFFEWWGHNKTCRQTGYSPELTLVNQIKKKKDYDLKIQIIVCIMCVLGGAGGEGGGGGGGEEG